MQYFSDGPNFKKLDEQFEGIKLCNTDFHHFKKIRSAFIESIESALGKRFSEFSPTSTMPVVNATCMADLRTWPQEWQDLKGFNLFSVDFGSFFFIFA
jgi:hypothetical protein